LIGRWTVSKFLLVEVVQQSPKNTIVGSQP
jgi:hypothetical protein